MRSAVLLAALALVIAAALAAPQDNRPKLTVEASHQRVGGNPGGHRETFKVNQDAWVSKNGNMRFGGYVQHDREKFGGFSNKQTHGGFQFSGRF